MVLPPLRVSTSAIRSSLPRMASAMARSTRPRSAGGSRGPASLSKAGRAALAARSRSSGPVLATSAYASPVSGLVTVKVFPAALGTNWPSIRSLVSNSVTAYTLSRHTAERSAEAQRLPGKAPRCLARIARVVDCATDPRIGVAARRGGERIDDGAAKRANTGNKQARALDFLHEPARMMPHLVRSVSGDDEMIDPYFEGFAEDPVQCVVDHVTAPARVVVRKRKIAADDGEEPVAISAAGKRDHRARPCDGEEDQAVDACLLAGGGEFRRHVRHIGTGLLMVVDQR